MSGSRAAGVGGAPAPRIGGVELVLLDLDGTVYEGTRPVPGGVAAIERLRAAGLAVFFTTNTDSITPAALVERLRRMGVPAGVDEVLTPVALAAQLFAGMPRPRVLAVASAGVRELLAPYLARAGEPAAHVLVSDPSYGATYAELDAAFRAVRAGAALVATQMNRVVRRDDGEHLDTGGWVRLLEYATGVDARVLGKPQPDFFRLALERAGARAAGALMVGDDRASDVGGAHRVGIRAVLVRTGKGSDPDGGARAAAPGGPPGAAPGAEPDAVLPSLAELPDLLGA